MPRLSDRWVGIALSVLLHAALLGALVYGWLLFRRPPRPAPTLAIEAHVVDARSVRGAVQAAPAAPPEPTPPESVGPPQPTPEELAQREQQRQQEEAAAEEQRRIEQQAAEAAAAEAARREAQQRAAAERKAREEAEAQKRATEEKQRQAQEQTQREEDLQRDLAAEEQARRARAGPALASWQSQIKARIEHAWLRPPTARPGLRCVLKVTQVPGGEVTKVSIGVCNGDQAVRESIEAAVYRASPLPAPPDPALFDRDLSIVFNPED